MRFFAFIFLILCALAVVQGVPAQKKKAPKCSNVCPANYDPVCGLDPKDSSSRPRIFSNSCVLSIHNCEHNSNLVEVEMSKCAKAGGVRIS